MTAVKSIQLILICCALSSATPAGTWLYSTSENTELDEGDQSRQKRELHLEAFTPPEQGENTELDEGD